MQEHHQVVELSSWRSRSVSDGRKWAWKQCLRGGGAGPGLRMYRSQLRRRRPARNTVPRVIGRQLRHCVCVCVDNLAVGHVRSLVANMKLHGWSIRLVLEGDNAPLTPEHMTIRNQASWCFGVERYNCKYGDKISDWGQMLIHVDFVTSPLSQSKKNSNAMLNHAQLGYCW